MFNKKNRNKIKFFLGMLLCALSVSIAPITSIAAEAGDVELYAEYKEWVYRIEDGKLYKALFNNSTGLYETDWIYVCDWPEGIE